MNSGGGWKPSAARATCVRGAAGSRLAAHFLPGQPEMPVFPERDCITIGWMADRVEVRVEVTAASRQLLSMG